MKFPISKDLDLDEIAKRLDISIKQVKKLLRRTPPEIRDLTIVRFETLKANEPTYVRKTLDGWETQEAMELKMKKNELIKKIIINREALCAKYKR